MYSNQEESLQTVADYVTTHLLAVTAIMGYLYKLRLKIIQHVFSKMKQVFWHITALSILKIYHIILYGKQVLNNAVSTTAN